jgi:Holliday junction resolvase RusA-like endonuclease
MVAPNLKVATVHVTAYYKTAAARDADNVLASFKAAFDGLTDAHIWTDDRGLTHEPVTIAKDAANPRAVITITWE